LDNKNNRNKAYVSKEGIVKLKKKKSTDEESMVMLKDCNTKECKTNCSRYTERNEERRRPRNRWKNKVKEGFNVMGIINSQVMARGSREWRKFLWEVKVHNGM